MLVNRPILAVGNNLGTGITGITFDQPILHAKLPEIIYELLSLNNTCFFGPNLEFVHTRSDMNEHYPKGLTEHLADGPKKILSLAEVWPLTWRNQQNHE